MSLDVMLPPQIVIQAGDDTIALDTSLRLEPDLDRVAVRLSTVSGAARGDYFEVPHVARREDALLAAIEQAAEKAREFYTEQARRKKMLRGW